jgi:hypothetical protein
MPLGSLARPWLVHYPENDTAPDRNDTRLHVSQNKTERKPFMKSKFGREQARHLPDVSLAAFLLLSSSASAGPPFITNDPEPVDYLHWELYSFSLGTHAMRDTSGVVPPSCDCNYGVLPNVHMQMPSANLTGARKICDCFRSMAYQLIAWTIKCSTVLLGPSFAYRRDFS